MKLEQNDWHKEIRSYPPTITRRSFKGFLALWCKLLYSVGIYGFTSEMWILGGSFGDLAREDDTQQCWPTSILLKDPILVLANVFDVLSWQWHHFLGQAMGASLWCH